MILADEPTGNLDSASTKEIIAILEQLHDSGRTVVIITHDDEHRGAGGPPGAGSKTEEWYWIQNIEEEKQHA